MNRLPGRIAVERELAHFDAKVGGTVDYQTTKMDFADYLKQGGQTARHRGLWRLLRALKQDGDLYRMKAV